jgi:hypothetical protein
VGIIDGASKKNYVEGNSIGTLMNQALSFGNQGDGVSIGSGAGSMAVVTGTLNSTPGSIFTIEFFSSPTSTPGQGKTYLGSVLPGRGAKWPGPLPPRWALRVTGFCTQTLYPFRPITELLGAQFGRLHAMKPSCYMVIVSAPCFQRMSAHESGASPGDVSPLPSVLVFLLRFQ